jgi:hypothetical protein
VIEIRPRWEIILMFVFMVVAFALGVTAGRFSAPSRVETRVEYKDRVVVQEKSVEKRVEGPVRVHTVVRTVPGPQGQERIVERTVERGQVVTELKREGQVAVETDLRQEKVVVREGPRLLIGPTVGVRLTDPLVPVYGGQVLWRFAGPLWLSAAADSTSSARLGLAIQF